jgi:hypothetical protein
VTGDVERLQAIQGLDASSRLADSSPVSGRGVEAGRLGV